MTYLDLKRNRIKSAVLNDMVYVLATIITFITFHIVNYICGTGIFGYNTVLKWDATGQYINWMAYLLDILKGNTEELFYTFSMPPGNGNALLLGWYLLSPYNLILLFFDKASLPDAYYWIECLKISSAGFTMSVYLMHQLKRKKADTNIINIIVILCFSLGYAYGGFVAAHTHEVLYFDAIIILPLVADALYQLYYSKNIVYYCLCLIYAILSNFYFGFMTCIFSLLFYLYLSFKHGFLMKNLALYFTSSIIGGGATAFVLLPIIYQIPLSKMSGEGATLFSITRWFYEIAILVLFMLAIYLLYKLLRSGNYRRIFKKKILVIADVISVALLIILLHEICNKLAYYGDYYNQTILALTRPFIGVFKLEDYMPWGLMSLYSGVMVTMLLVMYFIDYRPDAKMKLINTEALVACFFMMGMKHLNYVWHGFSHPAGSFYRWAFFISFFVLSICAEYVFELPTYDKIEAEKLISSRISIGITTSCILLLTIAVHYYRKNGYTFIDDRNIVLNFCFIIGYVGVAVVFAVFNAKKMLRYLISAAILVLFTVEIIINAVISVENFEFTSYKEYDSYISTASQIMTNISACDGDSEEYRLESDYCYEWYYIAGYNSIMHSSSAYTKRNRDFLLQFGIGVDDENKLIESQNNMTLEPELAGFLGIKYLISDDELKFDDYQLLNTYLDDFSGQRYYLYYNLRALPICFRSSDVNLDYDGESLDLSAISEFVKEYEERDGEKGLEASGASKYRATIIGNKDEIAVFSIPYEKGWRIYVNGMQMVPEKAYGFFLATRIDSGLNEIEIHYIPPYMHIGIIISMIMIVILIVICILLDKLKRVQSIIS